jgi:hypothetical protein
MLKTFQICFYVKKRRFLQLFFIEIISKIIALNPETFVFRRDRSGPSLIFFRASAASAAVAGEFV